jgi:oligosaccharide repeat unit polymerase
MISKDLLFSFCLSLCIALYLIIVFGGEALSLTFLFGLLSTTIILDDVVKVFRGKRDLLDPALLIGVVGTFLFFISPVSQMAWDYWPFLKNMNEHREWIHTWACLNFLGLLIYKWSSSRAIGISSSQSSNANTLKNWCFLDKRFRVVAPIFLTFCFLAQLYIYISFGGISGFVNAFTQRQEAGALSGNDPFEGMGLIMLVAESFKYIFAMYVMYLIGKSGRFRSNKAFLLVMAILAITFIVFGGLRGSRSATLFPLFFAAGMYHYYVRRLNLTLVAAGIAVTLLFSVSYYWYKIAGLQGIEAIYNVEARTNFNSQRQDANKYMISRDLGRMDFQSLALKNITTGENEPSFGRTYLVAIFSSIPKSIIPFNPAQITKEKTELLHGEGTYRHNAPRQTTLVLGQFGEAIVNFGPLGGLIFYFLLGRWVYMVRRLAVKLHTSDVRRLFLPVLNFIPVLVLITDMNVILYQLTRYLTLPVILLLICAKIFSFKLNSALVGEKCTIK